MECNESGAELQAVCKRDQTGVETKQLLYENTEHWTSRETSNMQNKRGSKFIKHKWSKICNLNMQDN